MSDKEPSLAFGVRIEAQRLGFDLVGTLPAGPTRAVRSYRAWLESGYHGEMAYLARRSAVRRRADPARIMPGVRSIVAVAANHYIIPLPAKLRDDPSRGVIASYAWGDDYHDVLLPRLRRLAAFVEKQSQGDLAWRAHVDTGPLLERDMAARAGLGFIGKNTNLIHPRLGSWLLLGELLLTVAIEAGPAPPAPGAQVTRRGEAGPGELGTCGRCTRCLDACPTAALVAPYVLDARRCISYLTIEHRGAISRELRSRLGNRIFGCDICQEVCPWNRRHARPTADSAFRIRSLGMAPRLLDLLAMDEEAFRRQVRGSPLKRAKRRGLLRNVCVALGNWGSPAAIPALHRALSDHEPLVRGHAAWALGRIATDEARMVLQQARGTEKDEWVREELAAAQASSMTAHASG